MNYLNEMKTFLKELALDQYSVRAEDVEVSELPSHYFDMGYTIKRIEESTSMEDIFNDIRMGRYENLGFFYYSPEGSAPALEQFMELFINHIKNKDSRK